MTLHSDETAQGAWHNRALSQPDPRNIWWMHQDITIVPGTFPEPENVFSYTIPAGISGTLYTLTDLVVWPMFDDLELTVISAGKLRWTHHYSSNASTAFPPETSMKMEFPNTPLVLGLNVIEVRLRRLGSLNFPSPSTAGLLMMMGRRSHPVRQNLEVTTA